MEFTLFTILCWVMGALYALLTLYLGFVWPFFMLWHGRAIIYDGGARYICLAIGALMATAAMMARTCFVATDAEYDPPRWLRLNLAVLVLSFLTVMPVAAYCWYLRYAPDEAYLSSVVVAPVWAMQLLFAWRAYRRYEEDESRREDLLDDD